MNDFERKIMNEYGQNHAFALLREAVETASQYKDVDDVQQIRNHEMFIAAMYRVTYLALKEYHNALSQYLSKHEISLPDLDNLVSDSSAHQN